MYNFTMDRFWNKVNKTKKCWVWTASRNRDGYGKFGINRGWIQAHRMSWIMHNGEIPKGMYILHGPIPAGLCVCHHCDNPPCVRPSHLFVGTLRDNSDDKISKNRGNFLYGENHPRAKLSRRQVDIIRSDYSDLHIPQIHIAKKYGIGKSQISKILNQRSWA